MPLFSLLHSSTLSDIFTYKVDQTEKVPIDSSFICCHPDRSGGIPRFTRRQRKERAYRCDMFWDWSAPVFVTGVDSCYE